MRGRLLTSLPACTACPLDWFAPLVTSLCTPASVRAYPGSHYCSLLRLALPYVSVAIARAGPSLLSPAPAPCSHIIWLVLLLLSMWRYKEWRVVVPRVQAARLPAAPSKDALERESSERSGPGCVAATCGSEEAP